MALALSSLHKLSSGDENKAGHCLRPVEMRVEASPFQQGILTGFTEYPGCTLSGQPLALRAKTLVQYVFSRPMSHPSNVEESLS